MDHGKRIPEIDALKGLAIIAVVFLHTSLATGSLVGWEGVAQAVPIFIFLMGYAGAYGLEHKEWKGWKAYLKRRAVRLLVPLALLAIVLAVLRTNIASVITGNTGGYFILLAVQVALVLPLVCWAYRKDPFLVLLAAAGINLAYNLFVPPSNFWSNVGLPADLLLVTVAAGLAMKDSRIEIIAVPAIVSAAYVIFTGQHYSIFGMGYTVAAAMLLLWVFSRIRIPFLEAAGRASYHILLVQAAFFYFTINANMELIGVASAIPMEVGQMIFCVAAGLLWFWAESKILGRKPETSSSANAVHRR